MYFCLAGTSFLIFFQISLTLVVCHIEDYYLVLFKMNEDDG